MDLVLASNRKYFFHLAVAVGCAASAENRPERLAVHILESDWTDQERDAVNKVCNQFECACNFYRSDLRRFRKLPTLLHLSLDAYSRLLAAELVSVEKFVYIDCDVQVLRWPKEKIDFGMEGIFAAVEQRNSDIGRDFCQRWGLSSDGFYCNSGVIGVHAERWRKHGLTDRLLIWLGANASKLAFCDQDALAYEFWKTVILLPPHWNLEARHYFDRACNVRLDADLVAALLDPSFVHYTGSEKPWCAVSALPGLGRWWSTAQTVATIMSLEHRQFMSRSGHAMEKMTSLGRVVRFRLGGLYRRLVAS